MPLSAPCEFCNHSVSSAIGDFTDFVPRSTTPESSKKSRSTILDFSYELYRNLFHRFGFDFDLDEEYSVARLNTPYSDEIEESVWGLSYAFRDYYMTRFFKLFPYIFNSVERYLFYIKSFGKHLFREHVCSFKFLVFCGFLSELTAFCHRRAVGSVLNTVPMILKIFFDRHISTEFYTKGGWPRLQRTAEILSIGYKRMENKIDFDPQIEKQFYSWEEVVNAVDETVCPYIIDPWITQTSYYLSLLSEDVDIFHISTENVSDIEADLQNLRLTTDDSETQYSSEHRYDIQGTESQAQKTENVDEDVVEESVVQESADLDMQIIRSCSKVREGCTKTFEALDVDESLHIYLQYIRSDFKEELKFQVAEQCFRTVNVSRDN